MDSIALWPHWVWRVKAMAEEWKLGAERGWGIYSAAFPHQPSPCRASVPHGHGFCQVAFLHSSSSCWALVTLLSPLVFSGVWTVNGLLLLIVPSASLTLVGSVPLPRFCK